MNKCIPSCSGIMIPGSSQGSDLSTSISVIKKKLCDILLATQKLDSLHNVLGWPNSDEWHSENFIEFHGYSS